MTSESTMKVELPTGTHYVKGRLKGVSAPPGTLLGPNDLGEYFVALRATENGLEVGFATQPDVDALRTLEEPRSVVEYRHLRGLAVRRAAHRAVS